MIGKERVQDELAAWGIEQKPGVLDRINEEMVWRSLRKTLRKVFKDSKNGRSSYLPVVLFKVLLLQQWYGLSDPMAEEAISDRLSCRRLLGRGRLRRLRRSQACAAGTRAIHGARIWATGHSRGARCD